MRSRPPRPSWSLEWLPLGASKLCFDCVERLGLSWGNWTGYIKDGSPLIRLASGFFTSRKWWASHELNHQQGDLDVSLKAVGPSHWQRYYILLIGGNPCGLFLWRPTGGASFSCSATTWVLGLKTTVRSRPAGSATDRAEIKTTALWWFSTLVLQFSFTEIFNRLWHKIKRRRVVWLFYCSYSAYSENLNGNLYFPFKLWTIIPQSQKEYYRKSSRAESVGCAHEKSAKPSLPTANILLCRHHRLLFLSVWCLHMLTIRDLVGKTWLMEAYRVLRRAQTSPN